MKHFLLGFVTASILWVGVLVFGFDFFGSTEVLQDTEKVAEVETDTEISKDSGKKKGRKGRRGRGKSRDRANWQEGSGYEKGDGEVGDDLGGPGSREIGLDGSGSEEQLNESEIDRGIDSVFRGIERCLVLVPSDAPTAGKIIVGMHIASSGRVTKVNLKGPNALIKGECGACIQNKIKSIKYPSFDGPDMVAHYPITFE